MPSVDSAGDRRPRQLHPLLWVTSSYFVMAAVGMTLGSSSNTMLLNLGATAKQAAIYASLITAWYSLKPLWAPVLEMFRTKKFFVLVTQLGCAAGFVGAALALSPEGSRWSFLGLLAAMGLLGATMDIATDGVYVTTLGPRDQARYTGFQSMSWQLGALFAVGPLVSVTGLLRSAGYDYASAWRRVYLGLALVIVLVALHHAWALPAGSRAASAPTSLGDAARTFGDAIRSLFAKRGIWAMLAFAFLYRTSQGFLDKIGQSFMIDAPARGGLGLDNTVYGLLNGTVGIVGVIVGSLLGGFAVARFGLKRSLFWLCVALNLPNALYLWLAVARPGDPWLIGAAVTFEKFWFGVGSVGHMIYLMQQLAPGRYQTAHYAFATALLSLCYTFTGILSGVIQDRLGYAPFFVFVMIATLPSFLVTLAAPFHVATGEGG